MKDLNDLCRESLTEKTAEINKQADELADVMQEHLIPLGARKRIRSAAAKGSIGNVATGAVLGAGALGLGMAALKAKKYRERNRSNIPEEGYGGVYSVGSEMTPKQAGYTPSKENNELLRRLIRASQGAGTRDV